jgi:uncharacterized protein (DUF1330 family)
MSKNRYTKEEIGMLSEKLVSTYGDGGIWPTRRQWVRLLECDQNEKILVFHCFKFRDKAVYPDDPECNISGIEAAIGRYSESSSAVVQRSGQKVTHVGTSPLVVMGADEEWDSICVMEYPGRDAFISIFLDPGYIKGHHHRNAGADRHKTIIAKLETFDSMWVENSVKNLSDAKDGGGGICP